ncbi:DUF2235 domain-containing protein, partial [Bradyrhizobium sp. 30]|uniref:T6SS phospholipase effector Tle1-like catalytic domain-containing protein n=1 Tax=Bradyrhizobium sp. 30 TaxID=2782669 RepID=UPI001FF7EC23
WIIPRRAFSDSFPLHSLSPQLSEEGAIPRDAEGAVFHGARHFLDGTWNSIETNTNVWRMRALCASKGRDNKPQLIYYGLGVNGFIGGAFGQGLDENIRSAYEWLVENYNDGDEIFIFGFSRGAYTARALAGLIAIDGILKAGSPIGVSELFDRYRRGDGEETIWTLKDMEAAHSEKITDQERLLLRYSQLAYVNVVGVWDTVGSIGIEAGDFTGVSSSKFDYLQTGLRLPILNAQETPPQTSAACYLVNSKA